MALIAFSTTANSQLVASPRTGSLIMTLPPSILSQSLTKDQVYAVNCTATLSDGSVCTEEDLGNGGCLISCNTKAKDGKEEPAEDFMGSTCTRSHEFCCEAPGGDPANCGPSYTDDCAAKNSCCCG
ncbi:hypothetical protein TrCOL_g7137 [Triparma columacea]|uniref:Uncharacterized protein n=1 Tax=Triparma columacea TaxID=722753 RepID=A0A9W7L345_9STRA|nr:hypothetical protein TrCOL_g7137 [Triparma columacea]